MLPEWWLWLEFRSSWKWGLRFRRPNKRLGFGVAAFQFITAQWYIYYYAESKADLLACFAPCMVVNVSFLLFAYIVYCSFNKNVSQTLIPKMELDNGGLGKKYTHGRVTSSLNFSIGHYAGGMRREPWILESNSKNPQEPSERANGKSGWRHDW